MEKLDLLCDKVLEKDELRTIDRGFAEDIVCRVVSENKTLYESWEEKGFHRKARELKELMKEGRRRLRDVYGVFLSNPISDSERENYVDRVENDVSVVREIMERHVSTQERLPHYPYLYDQIFSFFGDVSSFLDLGCGYNPLSLCFLDDPPSVKMVDISDEELGFLSDILKTQRILHNHQTIDLTNQNEFSELAKKGEKEVCLCFKLLDSLESKKKGISEKLIKSLAASIKKGIIVSFSKRTISGRHLIEADRDWFHETLSSMEDIDIKTVESINEVFYMIKWKK